MTNQELIKACIKNQRVAQKALYDQYRGQMFSVCLRYGPDQDTACDALQEGFINVFENIHRLTDPLRLSSWIKKIIVRTSLEQLRKLKKLNFVQLEELPHLDNSGYSETIFELDYNYDKLIEHLNSMPTGYKTIFSMYVLDELNHQEIAEILSIDISTSRTQLHKARKYMQHLILNDKSLAQELKLRIQAS